MVRNIRNRESEDLAEAPAGRADEIRTEATTGASQDRHERVRRERSAGSLVAELEGMALH